MALSGSSVQVCILIVVDQLIHTCEDYNDRKQSSMDESEVSVVLKYGWMIKSVNGF